MSTNWDNPCEAYKSLRDAYMRLISGQAESEVEYIGNGVNRRVRYSIADMDKLEAEMNRAQEECQLSQGIEPRRKRHAIHGSFRGPRMPRNWSIRDR